MARRQIAEQDLRLAAPQHAADDAAPQAGEDLAGPPRHGRSRTRASTSAWPPGTPTTATSATTRRCSSSPWSSATSRATATSAWRCCAACRRTRSSASSTSSTAARRRRRSRAVAKAASAARRRPRPAEAEAPAQTVVEEFGLFRNPPRSLRTEITRYLREREADADWFDGTVLVARKALKRLYALLHVKPGERAQQILFDEDPPADSRLFALQGAGQGRRRPAEQARAIIEHRDPVPRRGHGRAADDADGAAGADRADEPAGADQQPRRRCKRRGALDNPDLKALIEQKLEAGQDRRRASAPSRPRRP